MSSALPIDALNRLIADTPELAAALRDAADAGAAADALVRAAGANGIAVERDAVAALLARDAATPDSGLSDDDLDSVAGGDPFRSTGLSASLGGGCVFITRAQDHRGAHCIEKHKSELPGYKG